MGIKTERVARREWEGGWYTESETGVQGETEKDESNGEKKGAFGVAVSSVYLGCWRTNRLDSAGTGLAS